MVLVAPRWPAAAIALLLPLAPPSLATASCPRPSTMQSHLARTTLRAAATARPAAPLSVLAPGLLPRTFTTSAAARLAQPQTGPTEPGHAPLHAAPVRKQRAQFAAQTPDYSKGPSALDKAASLFFFTEIVRGASLPAHHRRDLVLTLAPTRAGMAVVLEQVRLFPSSPPLRARVANSPPPRASR